MRTVFAVLVLTALVIVFPDALLQMPQGLVFSDGSLTELESRTTGLVNGTLAYNYALELERLALDHSVSGYSFRSGGSDGATASAMWIREQFQNLGLETRLESFEFTTWNMITPPTLTIDEDGAPETSGTKVLMDSFQPEHYSWPTPEGGIYADLVVLPLPSAGGEMGAEPIDTALWNTIDTLGKIVLIGREVRWNHTWEQVYTSKLTAQPPAAVIYTWWYETQASAPLSFSSTGGKPAPRLDGFGSYYWNLRIPVGWVNYDQGRMIRDKESSSNVSARVTIPAVISTGLHYNVVGDLPGSAHPEKSVIIMGHYDSVMDAGFLDNAAGTAAVIELARVFSNITHGGWYNSSYTLRFVALASEELIYVGSVHYVKQHKMEMGNVVAVINLDCLGSDSFTVARTEPAEDFDLDELVMNAAGDLNIAASLADLDSSDHVVFRNPVEGDDVLSYCWPGFDAGISDAVPVNSSTMLISYPLSYSSTSDPSTVGWIHTPYDNSTSTNTLNWLEIDDLEKQTEVASLTVLRLSPSSQRTAGSLPLSPWVLGAVAVVIVTSAIAVVYVLAKLRKARVSKAARNRM
jgi:hypothetical protein